MTATLDEDDDGPASRTKLNAIITKSNGIDEEANKKIEATADEAAGLSLGSVFISPRRWVSAFNAKVVTSWFRSLLLDADLTSNAAFRAEIGAVSQADLDALPQGIWNLAIAGTANALTADAPDGFPGTAVGQFFYLIPDASNTGAATLKIGSESAKPINDRFGDAISAGDLMADGGTLIRCSGSGGSEFRLV